MVIRCGGCDRKIFALIPIPRDIYKFGVDFLYFYNLILASGVLNYKLHSQFAAPFTMLVNPVKICYAEKRI